MFKAPLLLISPTHALDLNIFPHERLVLLAVPLLKHHPAVYRTVGVFRSKVIPLGYDKWMPLCEECDG